MVVYTVVIMGEVDAVFSNKENARQYVEYYIKGSGSEWECHGQEGLIWTCDVGHIEVTGHAILDKEGVLANAYYPWGRIRE